MNGSKLSDITAGGITMGFAGGIFDWCKVYTELDRRRGEKAAVRQMGFLAGGVKKRVLTQPIVRSCHIFSI